MRAVAIERRPWRSPGEVLSAFADEPYSCAFLSGGGGGRARWSYLMRQPDAVLTVGSTDPADPFQALDELLGERLAGAPSGPPFQGGVVGLAAYELGDRIERLGLGRHPDWPDLTAARYPALLAFDHQDQAVLAIGRGETQADAGRRAAQASDWLEAPGRKGAGRVLARTFDSDTQAEAYEAAVADVVSRIHAGEIFQANIARVWRGVLAGGVGPFDILARLLGNSPAPFAAWLRTEERALVSNSPERFIAVDASGRIETRPIKGTRPRGDGPDADAALMADLSASDKDRAENLMIVDLMRNDLSRVCAPGSVAAPELFRVESFPNVHHLVSTVTGRLAPGVGLGDLLRATFPPGSITGAPKVQAMEVIRRHEPPRGPYCGSMFWAGFDGAMDSSVLIRSLALVSDGDRWRFETRAGAGIVADSDPGAERLETEAKIAAIAAALTGSGR